MRLAFLILLVCLCSLSAAAAPPITAAAFTPDGEQVVIGSQAGIEIRTWPDLKVVSDIETKLTNIHDLSFSPDGKTLLIAGGSPSERGIVELLSWPEKRPLQRIAEHTDVVYRGAWSPDGSSIATASGDGLCQVFAAKTGQRISQFTGHSRAVLGIAFLPDNKIVSAGVDQTLQLWDSTTGKQLRSLDNHLAAVNDLAVRPGVNRDAPPIVASCSDDRTVRFWQPTIGRLIRFARVDSPPRCIAWTPDGKELLVGCNDGEVRRIDAESLESSKLTTPNKGRIHVLLLRGDQVLCGGEGGLFKSR